MKKPKINIRTVTERTQEIRAAALRDDDEAAHSKLDSLLLDVLRHIATVNSLAEVQELAKLALAADDISEVLLMKKPENDAQRLERWKAECEAEVTYQMTHTLEWSTTLCATATSVKAALANAYRAGHAAGRKEIGK